MHRSWRKGLPNFRCHVVTWGPHVYIAVARCNRVTFYCQFDLRMVLFNKITLGVSGSVMEKLSAQWRAKEGRWDGDVRCVRWIESRVRIARCQLQCFFQWIIAQSHHSNWEQGRAYFTWCSRGLTRMWKKRRSLLVWRWKVCGTAQKDCRHCRGPFWLIRRPNGVKQKRLGAQLWE